MKDKPIRTVEDLLARVRAEKAFRTTSLVEGAMKSFDDYRYSVGFISGLSHTEQLLKDLLESQNDDDLFPDPPT